MYLQSILSNLICIILQLVSGTEGAFKSWLGRQSEGEVSVCNHSVHLYFILVCTVCVVGWGGVICVGHDSGI